MRRSKRNSFKACARSTKSLEYSTEGHLSDLLPTVEKFEKKYAKWNQVGIKDANKNNQQETPPEIPITKGGY